ncbi:rod shape-determining protein MreD [Motilibacter peucedani]|uniref:Rod shape-determining protein MreD n=1 Tax=Motilibacter peucedani TaxID=598650 RepID=A0A420XNS4_9ACTN|nr:rod shape-determining protein MreD [Motilibacter peucedani]RKS73838.1 rod shape-determining protein MreD [Motilibacter peucedani]
MTTLRVPLAALLLLSAAVLQVSVLAPLRLPGATPDPTLLVVVGLALRWGPLPGAVAGFAGGLVLDLLPPAGGSAGRWAAVLVVVGYAVGRVFETVRDSPVAALVAVSCAAAGSVAGSAALGALVGDPAVYWPSVPRLCASAVIYDVLLTPLLVPAVTYLARRADAEPAERRARR